MIYKFYIFNEKSVVYQTYTPKNSEIGLTASDLYTRYLQPKKARPNDKSDQNNCYPLNLFFKFNGAK